jgi:hypothetical protein
VTTMVQQPAEKRPKPKPEPPSETGYRRAEIALAIDYCPEIHPCRECRWPVIRGYSCTHCGSGTP